MEQARMELVVQQVHKVNKVYPDQKAHKVFQA